MNPSKKELITVGFLLTLPAILGGALGAALGFFAIKDDIERGSHLVAETIIQSCTDEEEYPNEIRIQLPGRAVPVPSEEGDVTGEWEEAVNTFNQLI